MTETTSDKAELRRALLAKRQAIPDEVRALWNALIGTRVMAWWNANPVGTLGVYWPIRREPDLRDTYEMLAAHGVRLALPAVVAPDAPLVFLAWEAGAPLVKDKLGVMMPARRVEIEPDALLVPCVGFNAAKFRLGYGGGFYDRTLAGPARPVAVGISYACCEAVFAGDAHDVALDAVITEESELGY
ncbi:5-formyltetrahydrofolate cyclo-ligase [Noviherbaspirillum galbum]|uniref:5-formyltetrahydrofolate cyclo-ligase n=1 Tax=Noviherbaspirillum galbum TaxID=2709383 RepID=A0A6B3SL12_9BURK|nr:5-formyltetrahydrofolate cyclo-ligase [Noviherbaspirillum galbum]NEX61460.1 5-formyltetrahydrofolate cyclo-ligase [Noviherbaspirillum galbum]